MYMFKTVPAEIKAEILTKIKEGQKAPTLAKQYGISSKTIYYWLSRLTQPDISLLEYNRIKRENTELKRIIGMMAFDIEQGKKRKLSKTKYQ